MTAWQWFGALTLVLVLELGCYWTLGKDRVALGLANLIWIVALTILAIAVGLIMLVWGKWTPW